jgi:hypothetical protein
MNDARLKEFPDPMIWSRDFAVITEPVTDADRQTELIEAESKFEEREEILLFKPALDDFGTLVVGRLAGKWYAALRVRIGTREIKERLDGEQACCKRRPDMVMRACNRFNGWLDANLGQAAAQGFKNSVELVKAAHAEREE